MIGYRKRWHHDSQHGDGYRHPLDRERREQWKARVKMHRRAKRLTAEHEDVALYLPRFLGQDGQCTPSHLTLANASGYCLNTVKEALKRLAACGLLAWVRRLARVDGKVRQTSNSYKLTLGDAPQMPSPLVARCEATTRRGMNQQESSLINQPVSGAAMDWWDAKQALAKRAELFEAKLRAEYAAKYMRFS